MKCEDAARTVDLIYQTYPEYGKVYGERTDLVSGVFSLYATAKSAALVAREQLPKDTETVVMDWGGLGDTFYTRLVVEHLQGKVAWITVPMVAGLYKDDPLTVIPGFSTPYRDPRQTWQREGLTPGLFDLMGRIFADYKFLPVSYLVGQHYPDWCKKPTTFSDLFFNAVGIERDPSIMPQLTHKGKSKLVVKQPYIVLEHASVTLGTLPVTSYSPLVKAMQKFNVPVVLIGGRRDPNVMGTVNAKGLPLYDTFSLMKHARVFVGRCSGNESMMGFLQEIPIVEVNVPQAVSFGQSCHPYCFPATPDKLTDSVLRLIRRTASKP